MKTITADLAARYAQAVLYCGPAENEADFIERDSRKTGKRSIYVALQGEKNDGNIFAKSAYENGCRIFLLSSEKIADEMKRDCSDASVILAKDTLYAMQRLAANYIASLDIKKIAITGSVGKTSTKDMIYKVMSSRYKTVCNHENFNNHIGVPLTAFRVDADTEIGIFEMGMNHKDEIHLLADIIRPQTAVITNVGTSHIGNLGSRDAILAAKLEITDFMDENSTLVYNADNDKLSTISDTDGGERRDDGERKDGGERRDNGERRDDGEHKDGGERRDGGYRRISVGENGDFLRIKDVKSLGEDGVEVVLETDDEKCAFHVPLPGIHNAWNAALAAACGLLYDIPLQKSAEALESMTGNAVRLNVTDSHGIQVINDTYNASPDSVRAALDVLNDRKGSRYIAVLADMLELGSDSDEYHFEIGKYAAQKGTDIVVAVGENARFIAKGAMECMDSDSVYHFGSVDEFIVKAHEIVKKGDVILVKGSHSMKMDKAAEYLTETGDWNE